MHKLYRQRTTDRYKTVGTFSNNQGYLSVKHDPLTGRFISK
jgi:hypothetical protein